MSYVLLFAFCACDEIVGVACKCVSDVVCFVVYCGCEHPAVCCVNACFASWGVARLETSGFIGVAGAGLY